MFVFSIIIILFAVQFTKDKDFFLIIQELLSLQKEQHFAMESRELEIWWSSLPISEKERIARKGLSKESPDGKADEE